MSNTASAPLPTQASPSAHVQFDAAARRVACSIHMQCPPSAVYRVWARVDEWHLWDPDTRSAQLSGPFEAGSVGRITPQKGFGLKMVLVEATFDRSFTVACSVLGSGMRFEHAVAAMNGGVDVTHTVQFSGWLGGLLMRFVGTDVAKGLPLTLTRLKAACEAAAR